MIWWIRHGWFPVLAGLLVCACDATERRPDTILVAGVYTASFADPWAATLHQSLRRSQDDLNIAYAWSEDVAPAQFEAVARDYISRGYRLIVGDCYGAELPARALAREFPEVRFCLGSEFPAVSPNFSVIAAGLQEPAFLCGLMAGRMSSSGIIGVVAGEPAPSVNRIVNAFRAGAVRGRADIEVLIEYTGQRDGAASPAAFAAARRLRAEGADVILAERPGAVKAGAESPPIPVFGCYADLNDLSPLNVISGAVWDPVPMLAETLEMVRRERFLPLDISCLGTMALGGAFLAPYHGHEGSCRRAWPRRWPRSGMSSWPVASGSTSTIQLPSLPKRPVVNTKRLV